MANRRIIQQKQRNAWNCSRMSSLSSTNSTPLQTTATTDTAKPCLQQSFIAWTFCSPKATVSYGRVCRYKQTIRLITMGTGFRRLVFCNMLFFFTSAYIYSTWLLDILQKKKWFLHFIRIRFLQWIWDQITDILDKENNIILIFMVKRWILVYLCCF